MRDATHGQPGVAGVRKTSCGTNGRRASGGHPRSSLSWTLDDFCIVRRVGATLRSDSERQHAAGGDVRHKFERDTASTRSNRHQHFPRQSLAGRRIKMVEKIRHQNQIIRAPKLHLERIARQPTRCVRVLDRNGTSLRNAAAWPSSSGILLH
jgi:hypothetical protein